MDPDTVDSIVAAGVATGQIRTPDAQAAAVPFILTPEGYVANSLESLLPTPVATRAIVSLKTGPSLAAYLNAFKSGATSVFHRQFSNGAAEVEAIIDYHDGESAGGCRHRAKFQPELTIDAAAWIGINNKAQQQHVLADWLEDRIHTVLTPDGGALLEIVRQFQATKTVEFKSAIRQRTGDVSITYSEDTVPKDMTVPEKIELVLPIYHGEQPQKIEARLRFKVDDRKLYLTVKLDRLDDVLRAAFVRVVESLQEAVTDVAFYEGTAPALETIYIK